MSEADHVVAAAWALLDRLNPTVPWSQEALELQHALVAYNNRLRVCPVCGEALPPGWDESTHARCREDGAA